MLSTMQDGQLSLARLLRHGATVHSESEVITWTGSEARRETYGELGKHAARLANALRSLGITGDQRVGTFMWNNAEHMAAYLAIPAMGAVLHTLNIRLFPEQLVFVANHAEDQVVIVDGTLVPLLAKQLPELKTVRHVIVANGDPSALPAPEGVQVHSYSELLAGQPDTFEWPEVDERSAAAMCYTSGTTGDPKGVAYSHRSIWLHSMQVTMSDSMRLAQHDKALAIVPMFHAMAWGMPYAAMMVGASLLMPDRFLQPAPIAQMLDAEKPTFAGAVPTIWQGLLSHLDANPQDISHLREVVVGGSAAPPSLMHAFEDRYNVPILHAWGMTETSPLGSVARPPAAATGEKAWEYRYTQGRFPASVSARLIGDNGEELPWDNESVGELEVQGPWIAASYYSGTSDEEPDPEKFHDGWLRTGDVGKISPDGYLTLTDRAKDVIKSGGEWISSVDLENQVMAHPAVAEAAVVGIPDEKWDERPLVAVVVKEGQHVTAEELRAFLADKVAKWQLPENWTFVDEVPKTSVGKFDKKRLRAFHSEGKLDISQL
ncbi:long-chain fatty acid--CoA ligase [Amycolatopsis regifaucium]|uniref:Long-chain fatty acid--CoA ligase n=1 Tax=Amycolatopsis regifaucium TaxID=546365 RepID=A0A154MV43_9PSEU|nr:long-chain fatty acid--CoA ligase [Amycolatopsis regifaucium]KZB87349.1 long-chain fatty acid--CoA ligase [Amycolatopsis regifaucium]OKA08183.1 long-chain fatty acid--CoA ligase [Amycolatopsis regifaucium]SFI42617.1 fatty-acyl-CoA synthase [Amycolatopsis regifaucium]